MGQAKIKRAQAAALDRAVVEAVGVALRKMAQAASSHLGGDCFLHAALGQALLAEKGVPSEIAAGYAAWRTGESDGSVIAHTRQVKGYLPEGKQGFAYHAWLLVPGHIVDFTTYQLKAKALELDALDGGHTEVDWCPPMLLAPIAEVRSYREVAQGHAGLFYYERDLSMEPKLARMFSMDPEDLQIAKLILANPDVAVLGPNQMTD